MKILIADDFESEINLLAEVLKELGYEDVVSAFNGQEAIDILNANKIDVVITDFNMPFKSGGEVAKLALDKGVHKILIRSSHSVATLKQKMLDMGLEAGYALICKRDFDKAELKSYLSEFLLT